MGSDAHATGVNILAFYRRKSFPIWPCLGKVLGKIRIFVLKFKSFVLPFFRVLGSAQVFCDSLMGKVFLVGKCPSGKVLAFLPQYLPLAR